MKQTVTTQAHLQQQLLWVLLEHPASSAADAARRAGAGRPSASRALHALLRGGLVRRSGRAWEITPEGEAAVRAESRTAISTFPKGSPVTVAPVRAAALEAAAIARSAAGLGAISASILDVAAYAAQLQETIRPPDIGALMAAQLQETIRPPDIGALMAAQLQETIRPPVPVALLELSRELSLRAAYPSILDVIPLFADESSRRAAAAGESLRASAGAILSSAITEALAAQRAQLEAVEVASHNSAWWTQTVADSLRPMASLVSDLAAFPDLLTSSRAVVRRIGPAVASASGKVAVAEGRHMTTAIAAIASTPTADRGAGKASLLVPLAGSAAFIRGTRGLLTPTPRHEATPEPDFTASTRALAKRLASIHPTLEEMLLGAWERLSDGGRDWTRQAAQSARELLIQTLERLAADAPADPTADNRVTLKCRVRYVLGRSRTLSAWAEAQAEGVETVYRLLAAEAHEHEESRVSRDAMAGVLRSLEAVLWVLVAAIDGPVNTP